MNVSVLNRVTLKNTPGTFVVIGFWSIAQTPKVQVLCESTNDTTQIGIDQVDQIIDEDIRTSGYVSSDRTMHIAISFTEDQVVTLLDAVNVHYEDNPITADELRNNPVLLKKFMEEFQSCKHEIIDGSFDAAANDWGSELDQYR